MFVHESIVLLFVRAALALPTLLQYYCTTIAIGQYTTPLRGPRLLPFLFFLVLLLYMPNNTTYSIGNN